MNAVELLREQLQSAHDSLEMTMGDVTTESAAHFSQLGNAIPVGAAYAHAVIAEDIIVSTMLSKKTPLSMDNSQTGLSESMPGFDKWDQHEKWYKSVQVDIPTLQKFAQNVYRATDEYLTTLSENDLETEVDVPGLGKKSLAWLVTNYVILHIANLTGEISAAKGVQGLKGYPF